MKNLLKSTAAVFLILLLSISFFPLKACSQFSHKKTPSNAFEVSGGLSFGKSYSNDTIFDTSNPLGFTFEIGYRPDFISPNFLIGIYSFNLPGKNTFDPEPTFRGIGVKTSYMLLNWKSSVNPFVSFGAGWYQVDAPPAPICDPTACFDDGGIHASNGTTLSLSPGAGFYIRLNSHLALKTDATLFLPFQSEDIQNSRQKRFIYSSGLSFRF